MIKELNRQFGIGSNLVFNERRNGLVTAVIASPQATAEVVLQGAHVIDFCPRGELPVLWLSDAAQFGPGQAIRGGVPVCWPWFGPHPDDAARPQHGFARTSGWQVEETALVDDVVRIRLGLPMHLPQNWSSADEDNMRRFELSYEILVGTTLRMTLTTINHGDRTVSLTQALHSYFSIGDIADVSITGLSDCVFYDKTRDMQKSRSSGSLAIQSEVDRVYLSPEKTVSIHDPSQQRIIHVLSSASESCVVWNPWRDKAQSMSDFADDGYKTMVCVESTHAMDDARSIEAGGSVELSQEVSIEKMHA